jgi:hypothetical protein
VTLSNAKSTDKHPDNTFIDVIVLGTNERIFLSAHFLNSKNNNFGKCKNNPKTDDG